MKVSELGEFGLIDILSGISEKSVKSETESGRKLILGIGDDTAAWKGDSSVQLATADLLIEDVHFTLDIISWEELGWRAMAANLSDIAAMGGQPRYALVSIALPGNTEVEDVEALYKGMTELSGKFGTAIVGGDVSSAPQLFINITIFGNATDEGILTRSAAKSGDKVAVTGYLGASAAGLEILKNRTDIDSKSASELKQAFLKPNPRVAEGQALVEHGVKAAIDISDGLIADLGHICRMSGVGARIESEKVPVHPAVKEYYKENTLKMALTGGEDYELLFTADEETVNRVRENVACPVTVIGEITASEAGKITLVDSEGKDTGLLGTGWDHFTGETGRI